MISIEFPDALSTLNYDRERKSRRADSTVRDAQAKLRTYFLNRREEQNLEQYVNSRENLDSPDRLLPKNWALANAMAPPPRGSEGFITIEVLELPELPKDADLLAQPHEHDETLVDALLSLADNHGVAFDSVTWVLYQKRPRLVPILDPWMRTALGVQWIRGKDEGANEGVFRNGIRAMRIAAEFSDNPASLDALERWILEDAPFGAGITMSRQRILGACASILAKP